MVCGSLVLATDGPDLVIFGSLECICGGLCVMTTYRLALISMRCVKLVQRQ